MVNSLTAIRTSAKRLRDPEILTPEEFQGLSGELGQRERLLVLLAGTTGLRARRADRITLGGYRLREEYCQRHPRNLA